MSQAVNSTIDERIVEMKFDNKQFESGVKQTMSTLDRLKAALHFDTDTKGIEKIQNTFNNFNLQAPMAAVDAFSQKLSAMQIFGKRIVENLADDFYAAIMKVKSGITAVFNQISTGGANRALNIEQAKFQLEGLHIAWEDIKGDIDYAVSGTAYGLDAAAKVAAQLSASQIQVGEDMKNALRGISGVAAMTNSSYEDIGRVFTQVAGAGRLYTQDMLQLSSRGLNVAAALATQLGKTEGEIREMVTKGQIDFKTFSTAMNEAFGEQATKANDTYTGSLSNVKAALSRIGADIKAGHFETLRQVFVDLIPKINEFKKAFKPVENVIIEVEAAVGKLLQKIISMVDVKKIVEKIAKPVEKFGKKILEIVDVITEALGKVDTITTNSPFATLVSNIKAGYTTFEEYGRKYKYVSREMAMRMGGFGDAVKATGKEIQKTNEETVKMSEDMEKALQAAKDIWNKGEYGNGQQRIDALTAAGIDPKKTQAIIEEFIKNGYNWDEAVKKVSEDTGEGVDENSEKAEKLKKRITTLATIFSNIKRTIVAVATSVGNVLKALFKSVTGSMEELGVGDIFIKITGFVADLAEKFMITEEMADKLTKPVKVLLDILKSAIRIGGTIVKTIGKVIIGMGKIIYSLGKSIIENSTIKAFIGELVYGFKHVGESISNFVKTAKNSVGVQKFVAVLKTIGSVLFSAVYTVLDKILDLLSDVIDSLSNFLGLLADIFMGFFKGFKFVGGTVTGFFKTLYDNLEIEFFAEQFKEAFKYFRDPTNAEAVGDNIFINMFGFIKHTLEWLLTKIKELQINDILASLKDVISIGAILATMKALKNLQKMLGEFGKLAKGVNDLLASTAKVNKSIASLNKAKAFGQIAKVILAFAASVALLLFAMTRAAKYISDSEANAAAFDKAMDAVATLIGKVGIAILGIIAALKLTDLAISMFTSKTKIHVPLLLQFAAFMFSIGYAVKMILKALITLNTEYDKDGNKIDYSLGAKRLGKIALAIGGFFAGLSLIMGIINRLLGGGGEQATKGLYAMSLIVLSLAVAIDALMLSVSWMSMMIMGYGEDIVDAAVKKIDKIIWTIMLNLSILTAAIGLLTANGTDVKDLSKTFAAIAGIFLAIGISLIGVMIAVNDLTLSMKLFPEETIASFWAIWFFMESLLVTFVAMAAQLNGINEHGAAAMKSIKDILISLIVLIAAVGLVSSIAVHDKFDALAITSMMAGLMGIVEAMAHLMEVVGDKKPKAKSIKALAVAFLGLASILVPLLGFRNLSATDAAAIAGAMVFLSAIAGTISYTVKELGGTNPADWKAIAALGAAFAGLGAILVPLIWFTNNLSENSMFAIVGAMSALALIAATMSYTVKELGTATNAKAGRLGALAGVFASLAAILVPLIFFTNKNEWDAAAIGAAMAGLTLVVAAMSKVLEALGTATEAKAGRLGALAGVFGSLTLILLPLMGLEGVDWTSIAAAMLGLTAVVAAMSVVIKALSATTNWAQLLSIGGAFLGMAAGLSLLSYVLAKMSSEVDVEGIVAITAAITALGTAITILGVVVGKIPQATAGIIIVTGALGALALIVWGVFNGINSLMNQYPDFIRNTREFAYTLGEIPRIIKGSLDGKTREELGINSPSTVFYEIGDYCMQGLFLGIKDGLVSGVKTLVNLLKTCIIDPICKFFKIASPSKVLEGIGKFVSEGFINGIKNTLEDGLDFNEIFSVVKSVATEGPMSAFTTAGKIFGNGLGDSISEGLSDSFSLDGILDKLNLGNITDNINVESFSIDSLIDTDSIGSFDLTNYSEAISEATNQGVEESFRGVDYSKLYSWEDVVNSEALQEEIRNASQGAFVDAALEIQKQKEFMERYPSFQDYLNDIDNIAAPSIADAYHNGSEEMRDIIEQGLIKNYTDLTKLSEDAYKYLKSGLQQAQEEVDTEIQKMTKGPRTFEQDIEYRLNKNGPRTYEQDLTYRIVNSKGVYVGDTIGQAIGLDGNPLVCHVEGDALRSNIDAVATNVSSAINSVAADIKSKLDEMNKNVTMLDQSIVKGYAEMSTGLDDVSNSFGNTHVVLDTGALVGQLVGPMDNAIGELSRRKARG